MTATARVRDEGWVLLLCEDCNRPFHLTARQGRAIRQEKRSARCKSCRRVTRRLEIGSEHYRFWMARFTDEEIVEIAEWCWGEIDSWPADWRDGLSFGPVPPR